MKFKILTRTEDGREWWEEYDKDIPDARKWAEETVDRFNRTLRPGEQSRTLLDVVVLDRDNGKFHKWTKKTNGMSVPFKGQLVDLMFCERCGITGKRYGLGGDVTIDSKYRAKQYQDCRAAKEAMTNRSRLRKGELPPSQDTISQDGQA